VSQSLWVSIDTYGPRYEHQRLRQCPACVRPTTRIPQLPRARHPPLPRPCLPCSTPCQVQQRQGDPMVQAAVMTVQEVKKRRRSSPLSSLIAKHHRNGPRPPHAPGFAECRDEGAGRQVVGVVVGRACLCVGLLCGCYPPLSSSHPSAPSPKGPRLFCGRRPPAARGLGRLNSHICKVFAARIAGGEAWRRVDRGRRDLPHSNKVGEERHP